MTRVILLVLVPDPGRVLCRPRPNVAVGLSRKMAVVMGMAQNILQNICALRLGTPLVP